MISIVRTLGAPVIEAAGNSARKISTRPAPGGSAATVEVSCHTVGYRLHREQLRARATLPARDPPQVVAHHVHDHHILGAVLLRGGQLGGTDGHPARR
jgi:hypothetical protein